MNSQTLDFELLEAYLEGRLSEKDMYLVEREALEDPFVFDALEGLSNSPRRQEMLSLLQLQMRRRVAQAPLNKKRWNIQTHRISIAAAAAMLFLTAGVMFWMKNGAFDVEEKGVVEVALTPMGDINKSSAETSSSNEVPAKAESDIFLSTVPTEMKRAEVGVVSALEKKDLGSKNLETVPSEIIESSTMAVTSAAPKMAAARSAMVARPVFAGKVVDASTGEAIVGATLIHEIENVRYTTSVTGEFRIQQTDENKNGKYKFSAKGYVTQEVSLDSFQEAKISLVKEI